MGFFTKLKKNFSHGGVKIQLQAPASVSMEAPELPVVVTLQASDAATQVNSVVVDILAESQDQAFSDSIDTMNDSPQTTSQVVASAAFSEPFVLAPNEMRQIQLAIVMNAGAAVGAQLPEGSGAASVAHALQSLQSLGDALNSHSFTYTLEASAKLDGIVLGPATRQPLQILRPGQIGGAINFRI